MDRKGLFLLPAVVHGVAVVPAPEPDDPGTKDLVLSSMDEIQQACAPLAAKHWLSVLKALHAYVNESLRQRSPKSGKPTRAHVTAAGAEILNQSIEIVGRAHHKLDFVSRLYFLAHLKDHLACIIRHRQTPPL